MEHGRFPTKAGKKAMSKTRDKGRKAGRVERADSRERTAVQCNKEAEEYGRSWGNDRIEGRPIFAGLDFAGAS